MKFLLKIMFLVIITSGCITITNSDETDTKTKRNYYE